MKISRKLLAIGLTFLLFFTTAGCGAKSIEMTLNDGILENDYFSIDVSGYKDMLFGEEETGRTVDLAHAYLDLELVGRKQYIIVQGQKNKNFSLPTKEYFLADLQTSRDKNVVKAEMTRWDGIPGLSEDKGIIFGSAYEMKDGTLYYYTDIIFTTEDGMMFSIHFHDHDSDTEEDDIYKAAIDSFKLK